MRSFQSNPKRIKFRFVAVILLLGNPLTENNNALAACDEMSSSTISAFDLVETPKTIDSCAKDIVGSSRTSREKVVPSNSSPSSTTLLGDAAGIQSHGKSEAEEELAETLAKQKIVDEARAREIAEADRIAREKEAKGVPVAPADKNNIVAAAKSLTDKDQFSWFRANQTEDPDIRRRLKFVAAANEVTHDYKKERANLLATIAQLSQMAMTTQQRATNMGSVEDPALGTPTATSGVSPKSALAAKSTKLGEKTSAVSEESADPSLANADPNSLSEEDKKKLETAIGAAKKRKELLALKKKLKNQLKGSADQKSADAVDATKSFSGDLIPDEPDRSLASLDPEKEKEEFLNSAVFHAMQAQFSMDSGQTREEVQRMLDEVEKELGSTGDVLAGILESNSKSLFERIREAHRQCLKMECVLGWKR